MNPQSDDEPAAPAKVRLQSLERSDRAPYAAGSMGYSRWVRRLRLILPVVALGISAIVFLWPSMDERMAPVPVEKVAPDSIGKNELLSPRFESADEKAQPYTITAARAVQDTADADLVHLDAPVADMTMKDGMWLAIKAEQGAFRKNDQKLDLQGIVHLFQDSGYAAETKNLAIDLKAGMASTTEPVTAQGPAGTLQATGLDVRDKGAVLIFHGPAKLTLKQQQTATTSPDTLQPSSGTTP